jgi:predicted kinase
VFKEFMPTAVDLMAKEVVAAREMKRDIIWDQTSTTAASRTRKFNMLPDYYKIAIVFKTPEKEELEKRLASRPGKEIPMSVVEQMVFDLTADPPSLEEGFDEIWFAI